MADLTTVWVDGIGMHEDAQWLNAVQAALLAKTAALTALGTNIKFSNVATAFSRAANTYAPSGAADTVTIVPGASGVVLVLLAADITNTLQDTSYMTVALSGGNTVTAVDADGFLQVNAGVGAGFATTSMGFDLFTGLAAVSTVFTPQFKAKSGTSTFANRKLLVIPFP